jgi:adenylate cyclase
MNDPAAERMVDPTSRRLTRIGWLAGIISSTVVFVSIGFLIPIFFDPDQRASLGRENLPLMVVTLAVLGTVVMTVFRREYRAAVGWIVEGREPTEAEHLRTLRLPGRVALIDGAAWIVAAIAFGLFNLHHSLGFAAVVVSTIWLGGETTMGIVYLLYERTLAPITALALAAHLPRRSAALGIRQRLLFAWSLGTGVPILGVLIIGIVGVTKSGVEPTYVGGACLFLGGVAIATGLFATLMTARAISDPLTSVRDAVGRLAGGELDTLVTVDDASEVGLLQAGFNRMAEDLRDREHIRDLFGRHVGRDVAAAALGGGIRLGGEEREIGALFIDITGSTAVALAMPPTEVVRLLNRFFKVVIDEVEAEGGLVNKFEGDGALCVFGAPVASEDPAGQAMCAARRLAARLDRELPEVGFGIGVSAGRAVAGNVGSEARFEYTVIGDPVNEAARLCELAKEKEERIVASQAALDRAGEDEAGEWDVAERTVLRGRLDATGLALPRS